MSHLVLKSGLECTATGTLKYPKANALTSNNPDTFAGSLKMGDQVWIWNHTLRMSGKSVGKVTAKHSPYKNSVTVENLRGETITTSGPFVLLSDEQYADVIIYAK